MFGSGEAFHYLECGRCGSLQLLDVPVDLGRYYPEDYYSFNAQRSPDRLPVALARRAVGVFARRAPSAAARRLAASERVRIPAFFGWFAGLGLASSARICDVGCGDGATLDWLWRYGYRSLTGFDPYVQEDREVAPEVMVLKQGIEGMPDDWDMIMLNHSFEHMGEPELVLRQLSERIAPGGHILIRVPVADSWAWQRYGVKWVQLDAPRHLLIHTTTSMRVLTERVGLRIDSSYRDSKAMQFWGSEQYLQGLPLADPMVASAYGQPSPFSDAQIATFSRRARFLNRAGLGDSAVFVLSTH
jgi:SAM-dependent methyltransferase